MNNEFQSNMRGQWPYNTPRDLVIKIYDMCSNYTIQYIKGKVILIIGALSHQQYWRLAASKGDRCRLSVLRSIAQRTESRDMSFTALRLSAKNRRRTMQAKTSTAILHFESEDSKNKIVLQRYGIFY